MHNSTTDMYVHVYSEYHGTRVLEYTSVLVIDLVPYGARVAPGMEFFEREARSCLSLYNECLSRWGPSILFPCRNHKGHAPVRPGYLSPSRSGPETGFVAICIGFRTKNCDVLPHTMHKVTFTSPHVCAPHVHAGT